MPRGWKPIPRDNFGRFCRMVTLKTYYLDVADAVRALHRFELRFPDDNEAIQHSKELAAMFRQRCVPDDHGGLAITVLDQSNRKIHGGTCRSSLPATNMTTEFRPHFANKPQARAPVQIPHTIVSQSNFRVVGLDRRLSLSMPQARLDEHHGRGSSMSPDIISSGTAVCTIDRRVVV